jgi:hypothetical protein
MLFLEDANIFFDSMTAVLTTTMADRIIRFTRGALAKLGTYAGSAVSSSECAPSMHPVHCRPS